MVTARFSSVRGWSEVSIRCSRKKLKRSRRACFLFFLFVLRDGGPEGRGATRGRLAVAVDCVEGQELFESGIDTVGVHVAMKETTDLVF